MTTAKDNASANISKTNSKVEVTAEILIDEQDCSHEEPCDSLKALLARHMRYELCRDDHDKHELFNALAQSVKEQMLDDWRQTRLKDNQYQQKQVAYLSLEFLMGRALGNALLSLDITEDAQQVLTEYATNLEHIEQVEHDAGLGNGGLGRLAACFLDSCASLDLPVTGYGIRYQYGMFVQKIIDGYQVERPDRWLRNGNPWEVRISNHIVSVPFYGHTETHSFKQGHRHHVLVNTQKVLAIPYDMPIPGYKNNRINTLRLWKAEANDDFDLAEFNEGDYAEAVATKNLAEQITMVLYPNDASVNGKEWLKLGRCVGNYKSVDGIYQSYFIARGIRALVSSYDEKYASSYCRNHI